MSTCNNASVVFAHFDLVILEGLTWCVLVLSAIHLKTPLKANEHWFIP